MRVKKIVIFLCIIVCCWHGACAMAGKKAKVTPKAGPAADTELVEACKLKTTPLENTMCLVQGQIKECGDKIKTARDEKTTVEQKTGLLKDIVEILCQNITKTAIDGIEKIKGGVEAEIKRLEKDLEDIAKKTGEQEELSKKIVKTTSQKVLLAKLKTTNSQAQDSLESLTNFKPYNIDETERENRRRKETDEDIDASLKKISKSNFETTKKHSVSALYNLCAVLDAIGSFNASLKVDHLVIQASGIANTITLLSYEDSKRNYQTEFSAMQTDIDSIIKNLGG